MQGILLHTVSGWRSILCKAVSGLLNASTRGAQLNGVFRHIGDGQSYLSMTDVGQSWRTFEKRLNGQETACIIISGHDKQRTGRHRVDFGKKWVLTLTLLRKLRNHITDRDRTISILLFACDGHHAREAVSTLYKGSVLVTFTGEWLPSSDIDRWTQALSQWWPKDAQAVDLANLYLVKALKIRYGPIVFVAEGSELNLDSLLQAYSGYETIPAAVQRVAHRVGEHDILDGVKEELWIARVVLANEYGCALALLLAEQI